MSGRIAEERHQDGRVKIEATRPVLVSAVLVPSDLSGLDETTGTNNSNRGL